MKQQVSPAVIAAIVVVVLLVIGFVGWKALSGGSTSVDDATLKAHQAAKASSNK